MCRIYKIYISFEFGWICQKTDHSIRSSLRQHGKQHIKVKEDKKENKVKDAKKAEGVADDTRGKEVTLDERSDQFGPNTTSEGTGGRLGHAKENVLDIELGEVVMKQTEVAVKTTEVVKEAEVVKTSEDEVVVPTQRTLILHSTLY